VIQFQMGQNNTEELRNTFVSLLRLIVISSNNIRYNYTYIYWTCCILRYLQKKEN